MNLGKVSLNCAHISAVKSRILRGNMRDPLHNVKENSPFSSKFYQILRKWEEDRIPDTSPFIRWQCLCFPHSGYCNLLQIENGNSEMGKEIRSCHR